MNMNQLSVIRLAIVKPQMLLNITVHECDALTLLG